MDSEHRMGNRVEDLAVWPISRLEQCAAVKLELCFSGLP